MSSFIESNKRKNNHSSIPCSSGHATVSPSLVASHSYSPPSLAPRALDTSHVIHSDEESLFDETQKQHRSDHDCADDELVRSSDPSYSDTLIGPINRPLSAPLPAPSSSALSSSAQPIAASSSFSLRTFIIVFLLTYLSILALISLCTSICYTVSSSLSSSPQCSSSTSLFVLLNGIVSALLAIWLTVAWRLAPADFSDLALNTEVQDAEGFSLTSKWLVLAVLKQLLSIGDFAIFIYGNISVFRDSENNCFQKDPFLYRFAVFSIGSGYFSLIVPLVVFGYLSYRYKDYIFRSREERELHALSDAQRGKPATKNAIEKFTKKLLYDVEVGQRECSICYSEYIPNVSRLRSLPCQHIFHADCIEEWFQLKDNCPLCKHRISMPFPPLNREERKTAVSLQEHTPPVSATLRDSDSILSPLLQNDRASPVAHSPGSKVISQSSSVVTPSSSRISGRDASVAAALARLQTQRIAASIADSTSSSI